MKNCCADSGETIIINTGAGILRNILDISQSSDPLGRNRWHGCSFEFILRNPTAMVKPLTDAYSLFIPTMHWFDHRLAPIFREKSEIPPFLHEPVASVDYKMAQPGAWLFSILPTAWPASSFLISATTSFAKGNPWHSSLEKIRFPFSITSKDWERPTFPLTRAEGYALRISYLSSS